MNAFTIAAEMVERHEDRRKLVYDDKTGITVTRGTLMKGLATVGIGRNLSAVGLSDDEIDYLFNNDMNRAFGACGRVVASFKELSDNRQAALVDLCINTGEAGLAGFHKMLAAIEAKDWQKAHDELLDSTVEKTRATELAELLLKG